VLARCAEIAGGLSPALHGLSPQGPHHVVAYFNTLFNIYHNILHRRIRHSAQHYRASTERISPTILSRRYTHSAAARQQASCRMPDGPREAASSPPVKPLSVSPTFRYRFSRLPPQSRWLSPGAILSPGNTDRDGLHQAIAAAGSFMAT